MRSAPVAGLFLVLTAQVIHAEPAPGSCPQATAATVLWGESSPVTERSAEVHRVALADGAFVERLTGEAALAHLYNSMSRRPEAFAGARRALGARGFGATSTVYVERTIRLAKGPLGGGGATILPAQTHSEQNSDGEIVFWSWDDGQNATWEGAIYIEAYASGVAATWEGQIDASTAQHPWVYYRKTWEGGGGSPHPTRLDHLPPLPGIFPAATSAMPRRSRPQGAEVLPASFGTWAICWRSCVVTGCGTAAVGCIASGPLWPKCFALWCLGAEAACGLGCLM